MKTLIIICLTCIALPFLLCSKSGILGVFYTPSIVFTGNFNYSSTPNAGTPETLSGNYSYPNRCSLATNSVHMFFFSSDYSANPWTGCQIHLILYKTDSSYIITHDAIFNLAVYEIGSTNLNLTYLVTPADTNYPDYFLSMKVESFTREKGGNVSISAISISPQSIGTGSLPLVITKGTINGTL